MKIILLTLFLIGQSFAWSQDVFYKIYSTGSWENVSTTVSPIDGSIFAHYTDSIWPVDHFVKFSASGDTLWTSSINNQDSIYDLTAKTQTSDGGFLLTGNADPVGSGMATNYDMIVVKLTSNGFTEWSKVIGGAEFDTANDIIETSDGGFMLVGSTRSYTSNHSIQMIKLDNNGNISWSKLYSSGTFNFAARALEELDNGNYMISGSNFINPIFLITDASGNHISSQQINFSPSYDYNLIRSSAKATNGDVILTGAWNNHGTAMAIRINPMGDIVFIKYIDHINMTFGSNIIASDDNGFVVSGQLGQRALLAKFDSTGQQVWSRSYEAPVLPIYQDATSLDHHPDGGYVISGTIHYPHGYFPEVTVPDAFIIKTDENGYIPCYETQEFLDTDDIPIGSSAITISETSVVDYYTPTIGKLSRVFPDWNVECAENLGHEENTLSEINLYPNPTNDEVTISGFNHAEYVISDLSGRIVLKGLNGSSIDISNLPAATYMVKVFVEGGVVTKLLIKE